MRTILCRLNQPDDYLRPKFLCGIPACQKISCCATFRDGYGPVTFKRNSSCIVKGLHIDTDIDGDWFNSTQHFLYNWGGIHPRAKQRIGQRLATTALGLVYKLPNYPKGSPSLLGCKIHHHHENSNTKTNVNVLFVFSVNADNIEVVPPEKRKIPTKELQYCIYTFGQVSSCKNWEVAKVLEPFNGTAFKTSIPIDISSQIGLQFRYAYSESPCVDLDDPNVKNGLAPAPLNNCVVKTRLGLPLNPFLAQVEGQKCNVLPFQN
mmetsp:Transcript_16100/g.19964  ORF Transcript_16100/g.19964 Transcript_16100/m.19964 type:complete len:263 (-) Transcript_16100:152-940(-)